MVLQRKRKKFSYHIKIIRENGGRAKLLQETPIPIVGIDVPECHYDKNEMDNNQTLVETKSKQTTLHDQKIYTSLNYPQDQVTFAPKPSLCLQTMTAIVSSER